MQTIGLLNPISVAQADGAYRLVAGRHRLEAHRRLGRETIRAVVLDLDELRCELAEIDENLIRAELTVLERGEHLARRKEIYEALHPETKQGGAPGKPGGGKVAKTPDSGVLVPSFVEETARKTGKGKSTVFEEIQIATRLDEEVKEQIRDTGLADQKTDLLLLAQQPAQVQKELVSRVVSGEAKTVRAAAGQLEKEAEEEKRQEISHTLSQDILPEGVRLEAKDFRSQAEGIPDESVSLIFTDPPYDRDSLPLYGDLARIAARVLRPGGSLLCYCGHYLLPDLLPLMTKHLRFWWPCAAAHSGPEARMREYGIVVGWKPILWFVKGTRGDKETFVRDVTFGQREKDHHPWQQAEVEARYWIEHLSRPGDLVWDPFCGSGTTALAARGLGRLALTCDTDPEAIEAALARLSGLRGDLDAAAG
jgi:ParB-like chromosome segregation protein Spo0J